MTRKNTISKEEKARRQAAADKLFNRAPEKAEEKKPAHISNLEYKIMESGISEEAWNAFEKKHGFLYLQTFKQWQNNGYRVKKGSKAKRIELYGVSNGRWSKKAYYYFTFEQVEKREEKAAVSIPEAKQTAKKTTKKAVKKAEKPDSKPTEQKPEQWTFETIPMEIFHRLPKEAQEALLPF